ncbi:MAG: YqhA family protein [Deltaproteobacteria bacterium]|nr:YqhA family protein [Deltaproteobacteria bacterium]
MDEKDGAPDEKAPERRRPRGPEARILEEQLQEEIKTRLIKGLIDGAIKQTTSRFNEEIKEQYHSGSALEDLVDKVVSGSRWIMAFVYVLLSFVLFAILSYTFIDVTKMTAKATKSLLAFIFLQQVPIDNSLVAVIAPAVKLLDLVLIGSLVVMVLIGGYENTVSRIGMKHSMPVWLGKLTISELKVKVSASIVIISSIHLLMEFLQLDFPSSQLGAFELEYYLPLVLTSVIHLVFIFSAIAITYINRLEVASHHQSAHSGDDGKAHQPKLDVNLVYGKK